MTATSPSAMTANSRAGTPARISSAPAGRRMAVSRDSMRASCDRPHPAKIDRSRDSGDQRDRSLRAELAVPVPPHRSCLPVARPRRGRPTPVPSVAAGAGIASAGRDPHQIRQPASRRGAVGSTPGARRAVASGAGPASAAGGDGAGAVAPVRSGRWTAAWPVRSCSPPPGRCWCWRSSPGACWRRTSACRWRRSPGSSASCSPASPSARGSAAGWPTASTPRSCSPARSRSAARRPSPPSRSSGPSARRRSRPTRRPSSSSPPPASSCPSALLSAATPLVVKIQLGSLAETGPHRRPAVGARHGRARSSASSSPGSSSSPSSRPRRSSSRSAWSSSPSAPALWFHLGRRQPGRVVAAGVAARRRWRRGVAVAAAAAVRRRDRLLLRRRSAATTTARRAAPRARRPPPRLRRPRRPDVPRVQLHPAARRRRRRRLAGGRADRRRPPRRRRVHDPPLPRRHPARLGQPRARARPRRRRRWPRTSSGSCSSDQLRVVTGDARVDLRDVPDDSADLVIGDAFGGRAVPWHLTTTEFVRDIQRVLRDDGIYAQNVIDQPPLGFLHANVATLREVFAHVAVIGPTGRFDGTTGGNTIVVASDAPLPVAAIPRATRPRRRRRRRRRPGGDRRLHRRRPRPHRRTRPSGPTADVAGPLARSEDSADSGVSRCGWRRTAFGRTLDLTIHAHCGRGPKRSLTPSRR